MRELRRLARRRAAVLRRRRRRPGGRAARHGHGRAQRPAGAHRGAARRRGPGRHPGATGPRRSRRRSRPPSRVLAFRHRPRARRADGQRGPRRGLRGVRAACWPPPLPGPRRDEQVRRVASALRLDARLTAASAAARRPGRRRAAVPDASRSHVRRSRRERDYSPHASPRRSDGARGARGGRGERPLRSPAARACCRGCARASRASRRGAPAGLEGDAASVRPPRRLRRRRRGPRRAARGAGWSSGAPAITRDRGRHRSSKRPRRSTEYTREAQRALERARNAGSPTSRSVSVPTSAEPPRSSVEPDRFDYTRHPQATTPVGGRAREDRPRGDRVRRRRRGRGRRLRGAVERAGRRRRRSTSASATATTTRCARTCARSARCRC